MNFKQFSPIFASFQATSYFDPPKNVCLFKETSKGLGAVANVLNCDIVVYEYELQSHYCIYFHLYNCEKHEPLYPPDRYVLNSITTVLLQEWLWYKKTREGWYDIR